MKTFRLVAMVFGLATGLATGLAACGGAGGDGEGGDESDGGDDGGMPVPSGPCLDEEGPAGETLIWKRAAAFDADLRAALELDDACTELGVTSCADAHLIPLGGNEPFDLGMYRPVDDVLGTSPIAAERMVLGACLNRVAADEAGTPVVFTEIDFNAAAVDQAAAEATAEDLFRRLLARDATAEEIEIVAGLAQDVVPNVFATTACLAVGTTTEFTFL